MVQKNSRPGHPTTCGKIERFQQTMKSRFAAEYNQQRPHRSLQHRATPAALYKQLPKAVPGPSRDANAATGELLREFIIDNSKDYQPQK